MPRDAATLPAPKGLARRTVLVHQNDAMQLKADWLVEEVPVELRYNGDAFAVMMMTPTDFEDFAYGFSLSEGRVESETDIQAVTLHERLEGYVLEIDAPSFRSVGDDLERLLPGRSGCGLCGSRRLEEVLRAPPSVPVGPIVHPDALQRALNELQESQPLNRETGAVHAAAWARTNGDLLRGCAQFGDDHVKVIGYWDVSQSATPRRSSARAALASTSVNTSPARVPRRAWAVICSGRNGA